MKFLYVQAIEDGKSFGSLQDEFGERIQIYYRALPLRYARDKIRSLVLNELDKAGQYGWYFNEKALELYRGHFKHVSEEIHFYEFFVIGDYCRTLYRILKRSFFAKFVDAITLSVKRDHTLSQAEMLRIFGSFPNVQMVEPGLDNPKNLPLPHHLISAVCPAFSPYSDGEGPPKSLLKELYEKDQKEKKMKEKAKEQSNEKAKEQSDELSNCSCICTCKKLKSN